MAKFITVTAKKPSDNGYGIRINIDHILRYEDYKPGTKIDQIQPAGSIHVTESVDEIDERIKNA